MFVRKKSAKLGVVGLAASAVAFAVLAPAGAATPTALNNNLNQGAAPTSKPVANSTAGTGSIVFAGSDTIQYVVADLADSWNAQSASAKTINGKQYNVLSYNALADDGGAVTSIGTNWNGIDGTTDSVVTPNGSGPGLKLLGATDAGGGSVISYARSSSAPATGNLAAGGSADGTGFPFALDTVVLAVSAKNTTAPASLTDEQVLGIYDGTDTNWSDVGGKAGKIDPLQPKSGSGTAKFFAGQVANISAANQGPVDINTGSGVKNIPDSYTPAGASAAVPVPEHSGAPLAADSNAIVPISLGRAILWNQKNPNSQIRILGGFKEQRALWIFARTSKDGDAARGQTQVNPDVYADGAATQKLLSAAGYFCSTDAQAIIEADGFYPLAAGKCGVPKTTAGDIIPASGTNSEDHIAPASYYIDNPLLKISTGTNPGGGTTNPGGGTTTKPGGGTTTTPPATHPSGPSVALVKAEYKLTKDQKALKKAKKQAKKAHGAKKAKLQKKIKKLKKHIKADKKAVRAAK